MTAKLALSLASALIAVCATASGAALAACEGAVSAQGRAAHGANYDPPRKYDTEAMARARAVTAWTEAVRARCPSHHAEWGRAKSKKIECEGYAGGIGCTVSAIPAK